MCVKIFFPAIARILLKAFVIWSYAAKQPFYMTCMLSVQQTRGFKRKKEKELFTNAEFTSNELYIFIELCVQ